MCCFGSGSANTPVKVADTRIFARRDGPRQLLAYAMEISADAPVAMILPLPVVQDGDENGVQFVSLEQCPEFFDALEGVFNPLQAGAAALGQTDLGAAAPTLPVHTVSSFEASYVPTMGDFSRLDPRFRLPDDVWHDLPQYGDYGFAVFKLRAGMRQTFHPMAFWFSTRDQRRLFFPTVHVHDGQAHRSAWFDHVLFYQRNLPQLQSLVNSEPVYVEERGSYEDTVDAMKRQGRAHGRWWRQMQALQESFEDRFSHRTAAKSIGRCAEIDRRIIEDRDMLDRLAGVIREDWHLFRREIQGEAPNEDTWIADSDPAIS